MGHFLCATFYSGSFLMFSYAPVTSVHAQKAMPWGQPWTVT